MFNFLIKYLLNSDKMHIPKPKNPAHWQDFSIKSI